MTLGMLFIAMLKMWWAWPVPIALIIGIVMEVKNERKNKRARYGCNQ